MGQLNKNFISLYEKLRFSGKKIRLCVVDDSGHTGEFEFFDMGDKVNERIAKTLLWAKGGYKFVTDDEGFAEYLKKEYSHGGARVFDVDFMKKIYMHDFCVECGEIPVNPVETANRGGNINGNRVGLDLGGSDIKACAMENGKVVYSARTPWLPKDNSDPSYHLERITAAVKDASSHLTSLDAVGVSSAGVIISNELRVSSLFVSITDENYPRARKLFFDLKKEFPHAAIEVANDGDVAALAGGMSLGARDMLGLSLGTSLAGGMMRDGKLNGWLNELAFVPIDLFDGGEVDEWSTDKGCGVKYLSQGGVLILAERGGFIFPDGLSESKRMRYFCANADSALRAEVFRTVGEYLAHGLMVWQYFYKVDKALVMGGVISAGGADILESANKTLKMYGSNMEIILPSSKTSGTDQCTAAASLPMVK